MHSISTKISPWERTEALTKECLEILKILLKSHHSKNEPLEVGDYVVPFLTETSISFGIPKIYKRTDSHLFTQEDTDEKDCMLAVADKEKIQRLYKKYIFQEPPRVGFPLPWFEYHWSYDGNLEFLRIDITHNIWIIYQLENSFNKVIYFDNRLVTAQQAGKMCEDLPETLCETTQILGQQIPHIINFSDKANRIFEQSGILDFVNACKKKVHN